MSTIRSLSNACRATDLHAGLGVRVGAFLVDMMILGVATALATYLLVYGLHQPFNSIRNLALACGAWWLYFALFESSSLRASPGKLLFGLQVVDECGNRIGLVRAGVRVLGMLLCLGSAVSGLALVYALLGMRYFVGLSAILIGLWRPVFRKILREHALPDWLPGTCVVLKNSQQVIHPERK